MTRTLIIATFGIVWMAIAAMPSAAFAAGEDKEAAATAKATAIVKAVNAAYYHFDPDTQFEAVCGIKRGDKEVGKLELKFFCPGKLQVDFKGTDAATQDDRKITILFRDMLEAAMIEPGLVDRGYAADLHEQAQTLKMGGASVDLPAGCYVLAERMVPETIVREFFIVSDDNQVLQYVIEYREKAPGGRGEIRSMKTRRVDGKSFVESAAIKTWEGAVSTTHSAEFTYMKKNEAPFLKRIEIESAQTTQLRAGPETKTIRWVVATESVEFKKKAAPSPAPAVGGEVTTRPEQVAADILAAYKAKDAKAMIKHASKANKKMMEELADQGDKHPRYNSLFGDDSWRMKAIKAWSGKWDAARYPSPTEAIVLFGGDTDEHVVTLVLEDGQWRFQDINRHSPGYWHNTPEKP